MECKYKLTDCLIGHSSEVTSLSIAPDPQLYTSSINYFVSGSKDGTVIIWKSDMLENNIPNTTLYRVLKGHSDVVQKVAITNDQKYVISGSWDCNVCIWDIQSGECIKTIKHQSQIIDISYQQADIDYISSVQSNGMVMIWKLFSKIEEPTFHKSFHNDDNNNNNNNNNGINCCLLGYFPSLCTAGSDNKIFNCLNEFNEELKSVKYNKSKNLKRKIPQFFKHKGGKINDISFSPDYSILASGCSEGELYLYSYNEPHIDRLMHFKADNQINNITFNPLKYWCIAANDNNIIIWDLESKNVIVNIIIDDLGHDINNENKNEIISKYKENWRDLEYHKTQLNLKKDQGILDKPFIRSLSICWLNGDIFYVACDDGTIREYTLKQ
ncbi:hypothetical protein ACTFIY_006724 [Dictyostelium cf. discoideum]